MGRLIKVLIPLLCLLVLASCSGGGGANGNGTEPVRLRLKWLYNASFADEIWGRGDGPVPQGGPGRVAPGRRTRAGCDQEPELSRAEFGIASADQVIRAASKGAEILVLAQVFQSNPLRWIYSRKRLGYLRPEGLAGLTMGVTFGGNDEAIFAALLNRAACPPGE